MSAALEPGMVVECTSMDGTPAPYLSTWRVEACGTAPGSCSCHGGPFLELPWVRLIGLPISLLAESAGLLGWCGLNFRPIGGDRSVEQIIAANKHPAPKEPVTA